MKLRPLSYWFLSGLAGISVLAMLLVFAPRYFKSAGEIVLTGGPVADWPAYGGNPGGTRYSPLNQINRQNVSQLEIAWEYHTGDFSDGSDGGQKTSFQATPILVEGVLYLSTPYGQVIALDPDTGEAIWTFKSGLDLSIRYSETASRGVSTWLDENLGPGQTCRRRIFLATRDARLIALDAATGKPCQDFGQGGEVDLTEGIRKPKPGHYGVTSPPAVIGDLVVVGSAIADNVSAAGERGLVRAFDARTGKMRWQFDPIPRDDSDPAWKTWEGNSAARTGAANV